MQFTYYGHSCFSLEVKGKKLLFDPFISGNELAKSIDIDSIEADFILVSHGHSDHISDCMTIARSTGATVITNWEIYEWLSAQDLTNIHPMNVGGSRVFSFGTLKCVVAHHSSSLPDGTYGGNPMGFVIKSEQANFYYAGDTALTMDMQLVPRFAPLNFAIFPIGDNFTMGYQDAIRAAHMVSCQQVIGVHYDTFGYIKIDQEAATEAFTKNGLTLHLPAIGSTINI
jgi:L-ascorbate metabolism protein UlaG (beta-lactamase superfamily)